jgi:hypothetical protein
MGESLNDFLPQSITEAPLPSNEEWTPEQAIARIQRTSRRIERLKPAVEDIIMDFWIAHEMIVNKKVQGWTWGRFCEECGYYHNTPLNWFRKYGLSFTKDPRGREPVLNEKSFKTLNSEPTPPPTTRPEVKEKLKEINKAIESGEITSRDLEGTRKAIDKRGVDKQRQKEVKDQLPKKTRIRLLNDKMASIADELQYLAEGAIEPERGDEIWIKAIKMKAPSFIWMFHKMGVDLNQVYSTLINPGKELGYASKRKEREERDGEEGIIDITPR